MNTNEKLTDFRAKERLLAVYHFFRDLSSYQAYIEWPHRKCALENHKMRPKNFLGRAKNGMP